RRRPAEGEQTGILEKELTLLRKEEAEASQVHLLLVRFHLREVRVVGEVAGEARWDRGFHVEAGVGAAVVRPRDRERAIGREVRDRIRLDLQIHAGRRRLQADEVGVLRGQHEPRAAAPRVAWVHERDLVLPAVDAHYLQAPILRAARGISQRLEWDGDL